MGNPAERSRLRTAWRWALPLAAAGIGLATLGYAQAPPLTRLQLNVVASGVVARTVQAGMALGSGPDDGGSPVCNCSSRWEYRCDDPELGYFQRVRQDPRLSALFQEAPHRLETYAHFQDFLREQFPHGVPSSPATGRFEQYDVLEMLDDAAAGSRFLCADISKMFIQLVQAAGGFARMVSIVDPAGSGHMVAEAWVEDLHKWVLFDPDYNVYFTNRRGEALSALELHDIHRSGRYERAVAHPGLSKNTQYRPSWHEFLLRHYDSLAFHRRANFVRASHSRWHPARHSVNTVSAWDDAGTAFPTISVHDVTSNEAELYFTPCRAERLDARARNGVNEIQAALGHARQIPQRAVVIAEYDATVLSR